MKMKEIYLATGLTDRTVRYYIEEGLVFPNYTENYLGRNTFDFSTEDTRDLQGISILRKFGSIREIRDASYYYRYKETVDYTYDIYASWSLEPTVFHEEVARVQSLLYEQSQSNRNLHLAETTKGNYRCVILFCVDTPFTPVINNYTYYLFAFIEKNQTLRYLVCGSMENGTDQPYYLSLEW